jgi:putative spermidine/putrescine transport system ATP-binding protein
MMSAGAAPYLRIEGLTKLYGTAAAVQDFSLDVTQGEMVVLLGPSGCGKTTTLRLVAGFVEATEGRILLDGRDYAALPPYQREMGMVFQSYALFPHMTVAQNIAFGLRMRKQSKAEIDARVEETLDMVKLTALADRYPRQLSGSPKGSAAGRAALEPRRQSAPVGRPRDPPVAARRRADSTDGHP